jgi:hypothetical protein
MSSACRRTLGHVAFERSRGLTWTHGRSQTGTAQALRETRGRSLFVDQLHKAVVFLVLLPALANPLLKMPRALSKAPGATTCVGACNVKRILQTSTNCAQLCKV